jgi:hypothetical protein
MKVARDTLIPFKGTGEPKGQVQTCCMKLSAKDCGWTSHWTGAGKRRQMRVFPQGHSDREPTYS